MRRLTMAAALLVVLAAPLARAQDNGYSGGWTDPTPTGTRDSKPLAYLGAANPLVGRVSHPNGINRVSAVLVPDPDHPVAKGCQASLDPNVAVDQSGTQATFHVNATFPCNLVYELRATAQANASGGVTSSTPPPYQLPLFVAVALPPAPVSQVDATLEVDGDDRNVTLNWPAGAETDLLGYVVTRTTEDKTVTLGQVTVDEAMTWLDRTPPIGKTSTYGVTAVRQGPDDEVKQVPANVTTVTVDVPPKSASTSGTGSGLTTVVTGQASKGQPDPNLLSQVRARGGNGQPGPPTTLDTGFQGTLPFRSGGQQTVAAGPQPSGDNAVVAVFDEGGSSSPFSNKPTMTFIAAGIAALVGAAVILHVTRRASLETY